MILAKIFAKKKKKLCQTITTEEQHEMIKIGNAITKRTSNFCFGYYLYYTAAYTQRKVLP